MNTMNIGKLALKKAGTLVLVGVLFASLAFTAVLLYEKNFKSEISFLVVQEDSGNQDYYSLSKSAEYLGKIMGEAIHSELFIDEVIKTGKVNPEFLPFDKKQKMKEWNRIVKVNKNYQLGIIEVTAFSNSPSEISKLSGAIIEVLTTKNNLFRGGSQNITIRVLSGPVVGSNPDFENMLMTIISGFVFGVIVGLAWIYFKKFEADQMVFNSEAYPYAERGIASNGETPNPDEYFESLR